MRERDDGLSGRAGEKLEGCFDHVALTKGIAGCSERSAHRMVGDQGPADSHSRRYVGERGDVYPHGGDACRFEHSLDVPHGHVTDGSNRYEQHGVDLGGAKLIGPEWCDPLAQLELRCRAHERIRVGGEFADDAIMLEFSHRPQRKGDVVVGQGGVDRVATVAHAKLIRWCLDWNMREGGLGAKELADSCFGLGLGHVLDSERLRVIAGNEVSARGHQRDPSLGEWCGEDAEWNVVVCKGALRLEVRAVRAALP